MSAIIVYLLMGFILLRTGTASTKYYPGPVRGAWYIMGWLPIEMGTMAGTAWAKVRLECENAVLCVMYDECVARDEELLRLVITNLCGQEPGSFIWWCTLKAMTKEGWLSKQTYNSADVTRYTPPGETWYSLTESGIREVRKRGLE